jgi:hypothetical protein
MAKVEIRFETPVQAAGGPIHNVSPASVEIINSSASSQTSTAAATHSGQTVSLTASGGAIRVAFGSGTLDAATGTTLIPDGATRSFGGVPFGHKVAVIDLA